MGAVIGGGGASGQANRVTDLLGTISGGAGNLAGDEDAVTDSAPNATVGGGFLNSARAEAAAVGGGEGNTAAGGGATVGGGLDNLAGGGTSTVGGGVNNQALAGSTTIAGGENNTVNHHAGTVAGGYTNLAGGDYAFVGGGQGNAADSRNASVGGGYANTPSGSYATIAGGISNQIQEQTMYADSYAAIGGGLANYIDGEGLSATIAGGQWNRATAPLATVPGGYFASASNYGQLAYASGRFDTTGDAQASLFVLRAETGNSTPTNLYLDGAAAQELITVSSGRAMAADILVVARSDSGLARGWRIEGVIKDQSGSVSLMGLVTSALGGDSGAGAWDVDPLGVGDAFTVQVQGAAGTNIRWVATVRTAEVAW